MSALEPAVEIVAPGAAEGDLDALAELLHACVAAGASVNFVRPFPHAAARDFWAHRVLPGVAAGTRLLFVLRDGDRLSGTVQLNLDTPPNGAHRAEVAKLLVHPACRRRGLGRRLMAALEAEARRRGRSLLTLDTRTGDAAEPLYRSLGYATVGTIPGYCRHPEDERLESTTIMYKAL